MRSCTICLFIILFVCLRTNGQTVEQIASFRKAGITNGSFKPILAKVVIGADTINAFRASTAPFNFMASNYYTNSLGFFCKKEIQLEKALKLPIKFRLGSLAYTDKLEGKGEGLLPAAGKR